ncbi:hypothetical protein L1887_32115 [Cichorium endivia]|nr:hypothetical protein L1887_32115 [Cichorium endivia]
MFQPYIAISLLPSFFCQSPSPSSESIVSVFVITRNNVFQRGENTHKSILSVFVIFARENEFERQKRRGLGETKQWLIIRIENTVLFGESVTLDVKMVHNLHKRGGTILDTARFPLRWNQSSRSVSSSPPDGYVVTKPGTTITGVKGVFASGDVQDKKYRQAITVVGLISLINFRSIPAAPTVKANAEPVKPSAKVSSKPLTPAQSDS